MSKEPLNTEELLASIAREEKNYSRLLKRYESKYADHRIAKKEIHRLEQIVREQHESHVTTLLEMTAQIDCYRERLGEDLSYNQ